MKKTRLYILFILLFIQFYSVSCKKLVEIDEPINTVTTRETFSTVGKANSAIIGMYYNMSYGDGNYTYASGALTINGGMSADELNIFGYTSNFQDNILQSNDDEILNRFWTPIYKNIYLANAAIEGLTASTLPESAKKPLQGEALFLRAFNYFYLVNLFGDVPLTTSSSWSATATAKRTPAVQVYQQIVSDLKDAQQLLPSDYPTADGQRTRANKSAATALLARVYLYTSQWQDAETQATAVIDNNTTYSLLADLNEVFLKNSNEAILQLQNSTLDNFLFATQEGNMFIPIDAISPPYFYLTDQLLGAFEPDDKRRYAWVDSTDFSGFYYYPYKYKVRATTADAITEYYTVLRLAEQYLIRAEARARNNKVTDAIADLNLIRERAGLADLSGSLDQTGVLAAVNQERRIELFAEWGHRWLDLKRTGQADVVLSPVKPQWLPTAKLYPLPLSELQTDPNLTQNQGY